MVIIILHIYVTRNSQLPLFLDSGESHRTRIRFCHTQSCPTWSSWSESSPCSVTCDGGIQQFSSTCIHNGNTATTCNGKLGYRYNDVSLSSEYRVFAISYNCTIKFPNIFGVFLKIAAYIATQMNF